MVQSLYEKLYHPSVPASSRVVERFDGDVLDDRWNIHLQSGTSFDVDMLTGVDNGVEATINGEDLGQLDFNIRLHYSNTASVCIWVSKRVSTTTTQAWNGFHSNQALNSLQCAFFRNSTAETFIDLLTGDAGGVTAGNTSIPVDAVYHRYEVELRSSNCSARMEGILEVTNTANLPTVGQNPVFMVDNLGISGARTAQATYCEAYNT